MHKSCASRDNTPKSHTHRKVDTRTDSGEEHVRWNLKSNVSSEKDRDRRVELIALETKIFLDTLNSGVGESVAVEVAVDIS
jgi:hypothetical protein